MILFQRYGRTQEPVSLTSGRTFKRESARLKASSAGGRGHELNRRERERERMRRMEGREG